MLWLISHVLTQSTLDISRLYCHRMFLHYSGWCRKPYHIKNTLAGFSHARFTCFPCTEHTSININIVKLKVLFKMKRYTVGFGFEVSCQVSLYRDGALGFYFSPQTKKISQDRSLNCFPSLCSLPWDPYSSIQLLRESIMNL